tara:strand:- start:847 stop:1761 length:915 start_codon:yes stop_codon:yes gene_type:complete
MKRIISSGSIKIRDQWVRKISQIEGNFSKNSKLLEKDLVNEIKTNGISSLLGHIRLCGNIPESYGHDTSVEKQYSKYTDALLSCSFNSIGLKSLVLDERADVADVEVYAKEFSFVADAKAFRLSRTAKNQKDFKVQAMDRWKHGNPFAMVVCPIYQLPSKNSQIYIQAITRNVCIFTYSHLALLVRYANEISKESAEKLLHNIFKTIPLLNPSKNAIDYWLSINNVILSHSKSIFELWQDEKLAAQESIEVSKVEALRFLSAKREEIMRMSYEEALNELLKSSKIDSKMNTISKINDNGLLGLK